MRESPEDAPFEAIDLADNSCCNANPDPCCDYLYCGGSLTPACIAEQACQSDGGTYNPTTVYELDGSIVGPSCSLPEGGPDATTDSEGPDAGGG